MQGSVTMVRTGPQIWRIILAVVLGAAAGLFISGYWLIDYFPVGSGQLALLAVLCAIGSAAGYYALIGAIGAGLARLGALHAASTILLGAVLGGFLLYAGTSQWQSAERHIPFLLPSHQFRLVVEGAPAGTSLVWLSTSLGDISYDSLSTKGWSRKGDTLVLHDPTANSLEWSAVTGARLELVLESAQPGGLMRLKTDGNENSIPLSARKTSYEQSFAVPFEASRELVILLGLLNFFVLSLGSVLGLRGPLRALVQEIERAGPMVAAQSARSEVWLLGLIAGLALILRVCNLGAVFPAVDEYYHLIAASQILNGAPLGAVYERGLWVVTLPVAGALRMLGHEIWAARTVGVVFNVLAIIPLYLVTRKINGRVALVACILYASSPWIITFARVAREYAYYPFYFYWIAYAMVLLVEAIPDGFAVRSQWRELTKPRVVLLVLLLALPPIFALSIDWLSTFRTILIAYLVLGAFVLSRFDWRDRGNWVWLGAAGLALLLAVRASYQEQASKLLLTPRLNPVPLEYFFPNPEQQWYFGRAAILAAAAVALVIPVSLASRRKRIAPLFFLGLFVSYLAVFAVFSKSFFHTRHLMSTQFWFVVVAAAGLSWLWDLLKVSSPWKGRAAAVALAVALGVGLLNPRQIALPSISIDPDMRISEDYMHDMSRVQAYMLSEVDERDVLIATVYGLYATWEGQPRFNENYRINSKTTKEEIIAIVNQHDSGWIVFDNIRLDLSPLTMKDFTNMPQMEYIGVFGDENVWRWEGGAASLHHASLEPQPWTFR